MILLTVGTQLGFDRLVAAMDAIAPDLDQPLIAQTGPGRYTPLNMQAEPFFRPSDFEELVARSMLIIAHAGIGSVLSARRHNTPIVLMPRRAKLGEHRNDHQLATAAHLRDREMIFVADDESDLPGAIERALAAGQSAHQSQPAGLAQLQSAISAFILGD